MINIKKFNIQHLKFPFLLDVSNVIFRKTLEMKFANFCSLWESQ